MDYTRPLSPLSRSWYATRSKMLSQQCRHRVSVFRCQRWRAERISIFTWSQRYSIRIHRISIQSKASISYSLRRSEAVGACERCQIRCIATMAFNTVTAIMVSVKAMIIFPPSYPYQRQRAQGGYG